ncbi:MAG: nonstructural protein [Microvirus sp.]|nr:MAG: nonstructural protein [Microvirus sp.]
MKLSIYSVYDSKTEAFAQPFYMQTKGAAIRAFSELANNKDHQIGKYPSDYGLFELGHWDDVSGVFVSHVVPLSMGLAQEFVK